MSTIEQLRAARALIGLDVGSLAAASGVSEDTIMALETNPRHPADTSVVMALATALERMGICFLAAGDCRDGGAGVRFATRGDTDEGMRPEDLNAANDD